MLERGLTFLSGLFSLPALRTVVCRHLFALPGLLETSESSWTYGKGSLLLQGSVVYVYFLAPRQCLVNEGQH